MINVIRIIFFAALAWPLIACTLTMPMEDMRRVFRDDIEHAVGFTHEQLKRGRFQFIGTRKPTETKQLENSNTLYVYGDYWLQYKIQRTPCDVYIEVDPKTEVVVNAYSKGKGCYRPY